MNKHVTIREIAQKAGLSINTVSRALNGKGEVHPETRKRVLALARSLGYTPNALARGLKGHSMQILGVVISDVANPFFGPVVRAIEEAASAIGYSIILVNTQEDAQRELAAVRLLVEKRVDGVIMTPVQPDTQALEILAQYQIPFVLVARRYPKGNYPYVINADQEGAALAVEHLLAQGHRQILYLGGSEGMSSADERLAGYFDAFAARGLEPLPALVRRIYPDMAAAATAVTQALDEGLAFTAVFTFNDYMAFGALQALAAAGRRVPQDVAVVGYDDISFAAAGQPALTTVRIDKEELGERAVALLWALLRGEPPQELGIVLPPALVVRDSSRFRGVCE